MNRKQIIFWIFLFLLPPMGVSAQQATKADIQALELKMITTLTEMDKRLTSQIADLDKQLTALQTTVTEMDKRLTNKISEMDKRVTTQINVLFWAIGALIALVLAVIALPQLLGYFQEKKARSDFQQEIDELKRRLEQQQQEIETLKSQRIVMPS
ncbi:TPA: hypothetical protein EYP66_00965 [Candidatus Poribacteria bacterium]|nr:hypothetical protein [Candidatus Poribacteria bacterium]